MLISVPQYIDVEDKIAGPLTAKQLGWMILLGVSLLIMWNMFSKPLFFIIAIPLTILLIAMAFYKPYGQPLGNFIVFGVLYFFRPKVYFWKRTPQKIADGGKKSQITASHTENKKITSESLMNLARIVDSEGTEYDEKFKEILKKVPPKKY